MHINLYKYELKQRGKEDKNFVYHLNLYTESHWTEVQGPMERTVLGIQKVKTMNPKNQEESSLCDKSRFNDISWVFVKDLPTQHPHSFCSCSELILYSKYTRV